MRTEKEIRERLKEILEIEEYTKIDMTQHINAFKYVLGEPVRHIGVYNPKTGKYKLNADLIAQYNEIGHKLYEERVANEA